MYIYVTACDKLLKQDATSHITQIISRIVNETQIDEFRLYSPIRRENGSFQRRSTQQITQHAVYREKTKPNTTKADMHQ